MSSTFALRPAVEDDVELTYDITREAMAPYVVATWGRWDEADQRAKHRLNYTPATHRLVVVGSEVAGLIAVELEPAHLWLVKLYLKTAFRNQGLGAALLRQVIGESASVGKATRLRVLKANPRALALYLRHGFEVVGEAPERYFMVRPFGESGRADQNRLTPVHTSGHACSSTRQHHAEPP